MPLLEGRAIGRQDVETAPRVAVVSPHDPATIAESVVIVLVATLVAGLLPARRASRIDPMAALRCE